MEIESRGISTKITFPDGEVRYAIKGEEEEGTISQAEARGRGVSHSHIGPAKE
jgi:hypothetical protein